jgi:hypothetical protein
MTINSEHSISESATTGPNNDRPGTLDSTAGTVYTIKSGGGTPTAANKVDINPS